MVDLIQMPGFLIFGGGFISPPEDLLDFVTAIVLVAICGFRWQFIVGFMAELVPGLTLFPTWTMMVLTLSTQPSPDECQRVPVNRVSGGHEPIDVEATVVPPVQPPPVK